MTHAAPSPHRVAGSGRRPLALAHDRAAQPSLVVRTVDLGRLPDGDGLLDLLPGPAPLAWVRRGSGLVGWGEVARIPVRGRERFLDAEQAWQGLVARSVVRDEVRLPGTGPIAFGSFAFDDADPDGGALVVPGAVVGRRGSRAWLTTIEPGAHVGPRPTLPRALGRRDPVLAPGAVRYEDGSLTAEAWADVVAAGIADIRAGRLEKVVLARDVLAIAAEPVDARWLLTRLAGAYPTCWTFCVDGLVGATPELLVRSEKGLVTSRVLAGTIRRTGDDDADVAHAAILAHSSKDLEEHEYAVSSVAAALEPFCSSTNVPEAPFVLHLPNVLHLASDVTGVLAARVDGGDVPSSLALAAALHPTAAVCGTPTAAARELITRIEGMDRARYAAPVGWIGADGDGEWGIALRSAQIDATDPRRLRLFAGCGIVAASDPVAELAEAEAKLDPVRGALADPS
jgi:menaquinone-specific isochorismate synthase